MDPKIVERYKHVQTLADRGGTEGERAAARSILDKLEERHPGLRAAVNSSGTSTPFDGAFGFPPRGDGAFRASGKAEPPRGSTLPWDDIFNLLRNAAEGLRDGVTLRGRLEEAVSLDTHVNTRTMKIVVSIPLAELDAIVEDFGDERLAEVATIISTMVRDEFVETVESMVLDEED